MNTKRTLLMQEMVRLLELEQESLLRSKNDEAKVYEQIAKKINFMIMKEASIRRRKTEGQK